MNFSISGILMKGIDKICTFYKRHWPFILVFVLFIGYSCCSSSFHALLFEPSDGKDFMFFFQKLCFTLVLASLTALIFLNNKKEPYIKPIIYIIIIILFFLQRFLIVSFGRAIGPDVLLMTAETNSDEASEFLKTFAFSQSSLRCYAECGLIILIIIITEFINKKQRLRCLSSPYLKFFFSVSCLILLLIGTFKFKTWIDLFKCNTTESLAAWEYEEKTRFSDIITKVIYAGKGMEIGKNEIISASMAIEKYKNDSFLCCSEDSLNIVLIIGESGIKNHYSIYGYNHDTTPNMLSEKRKGNLVAFNNVVSPYNVTTPAIKNLLSCNTLSKRENWAAFPFVPYVFYRAGYDVYFWDNQKKLDAGGGFTFELNSFLYNKYISPIYTALNDSCYKFDEDLVSSFIKSELKGKKHKFIIFHFMGQHIAFHSRYPRGGKYEFFSKDSVKRAEPWMNDEKKQDIAHYDNATLYHDFVISKLFDYFRDTPTIIIYLSDHGEEVYDYRNNKGRKFDNNRISANMVEYQFKVPFFIWMSDKYKVDHSELLEQIKLCKDRPFVTDITFNMLFGLAGIKTNYYNEQQDLLHKNFTTPKRLLMNEGIDCDAIH